MDWSKKEKLMKGFYLIECVIAMLMMSFVLCTLLFISVKLYEDTVDFHDSLLAKIIKISVKQANLLGVNYDAEPYAVSVLPGATVDKASGVICWTLKEKRCEV